ncbi:MAG: extracellular solute-binding protein [Magnetococcus sp. DMHC-6]
MQKKFFLRFFFLILFVTTQAQANSHGISLDGNLKYPANFQGFDYTSANAKPGGTLTLHAIGSFDKMNPYTLKGTAPDYLSTLLFETLTISSLDEPFAKYGLLAKEIHPAKDGLSISYTLDPEAKFSDGSPVTAHDVAFSLQTLKSDKAHPSYQTYWRDIQRTEVLDDHHITFYFTRENRELAMITGEIPLFSQAYFTKHPFEEAGMEAPLGSGPYLVETVNPGKTITYKRNPNYWGWKKPVLRGMYNFERIVLKYFMDPVVALEGFKAGEFDFIFENNSKQWARDYEGEKFTSKKILKQTLAHKNGAGMQGFVFNLRKSLFQDKRVRQAIGLALDFEWSNHNLFYDQYKRADSFFSNSDLAAQGKPSAAELALLEPFRAQVDPAVFAEVLPPPSTTPPHSLRDNLRQATQLLKQAGWQLGPDQILIHAPDGQRFTIETLLVSPAFERILAPFTANLKKLGIDMTYRTVDPSLYQQRLDAFDYDMVVEVFPQSQSPGNEQRNMWSSQSADIKGSHNRIGLKDPVVDALVDKIIYAEKRDDVVTACKVLDRVLLAGFYVVPNWYVPHHRIAFWNHFHQPEKAPLYYAPFDWLMAWWME